MGDRIGEVLEGRYRLRRVLGRGGMGVVYEAEHAVISRRVAVKMLHGEHVGSDDMARRFLQEAQSASTIHHPNVIEVQDVGQAGDGAIFIVMELLEGRSLSQALGGGAPMAPDRAVGITRQILAGLGAAHAARIVHRDLKPDNVFLAREIRGGQPVERVKILDFGISKGVAGGPETGLTRTGTVLGTAWYMAPEQARGDKDLDERADVWAVGVMLYQMLAGRLPYAGDSYNAVIAQILTEPVPPCLGHAPGLDPDLAAVVHRALTKDRHQRYATASAFDEALQPFAPGPPDPLPREPAQEQPRVDAPTGSADDATSETVATDAGTARTVATDAGTARTVATDAGTAQTVATDAGAAQTVATDAGTARTVATDAGAAVVPFAPTGQGTDDSASASASAPAEPDPAPAPAPPTAPRWKRALWYGLTLPLVALVLLVPVASRAALLRAFGLPADLPAVVAFIAAAVLCVGLGWCAVLAARAWQSGHPSRWLHAAPVIAAPALGLGLALLHYLTLAGQKTSHQVSLRAYSAITEAQARRMAQLIGESHNQFLSAVAVDQLILAVLGVLLLLGWLFHPRSSATEGRSPLRWLALPAGFLVIGLCHFVLFPRPLGFMGPTVFVCYLLWTLANIAVLRRGASPLAAWAALATALVTSAAITGTQIAAGYLQLFGVVAAKSANDLPPAEREAMFQTVINPSMGLGALLQWAVLGTLFALTWIVGRRSLAWPGKQARRPLVVFATVFLITALPTPILLGAMSSASDQWAPHKFAQMTPVARPGEQEPTFYMDRAPQSLALGQRLLYRALTSDGQRRREPSAADVRRVLSAHRACPKILEATLRQTGVAPPARCVTAIEARIYCERLGKRLPTPAEWDAALSRVKPGPASQTAPSALTRDDFGEWTMRKVHNTATFEIRGQSGGVDVPKRLAPNRFSRRVGFRCAFTFPGD